MTTDDYEDDDEEEEGPSAVRGKQPSGAAKGTVGKLAEKASNVAEVSAYPDPPPLQLPLSSLQALPRGCCVSSSYREASFHHFAMISVAAWRGTSRNFISSNILNLSLTV